MRNYLQLIGIALQNQLPPDFQSAFLFAEVDDGFTSLGVYFSSSPHRVVFRYAKRPLDDLVYRFWKNGQDRILPRSWATIEYMIVGTKLDVAFTYSGDFDIHEAPWVRDERVLARRFPGYVIDRSSPDARSEPVA